MCKGLDQLAGRDQQHKRQRNLQPDERRSQAACSRGRSQGPGSLFERVVHIQTADLKQRAAEEEEKDEEAPGEVPIFSRDISGQEIYAFDLQLP